MSKGLSRNKYCKYRAQIGVRFGLLRLSKTGGIAGSILRILRLRTGQRWPENEMRDCKIYFLTDPKHWGGEIEHALGDGLDPTENVVTMVTWMCAD